MDGLLAQTLRSHRRAILILFAVVLAVLAGFGLRAAAGVGDLTTYLVALYQMLLLACIVTPYVLTVVLFDQDEHEPGH